MTSTLFSNCKLPSEDEEPSLIYPIRFPMNFEGLEADIVYFQLQISGDWALVYVDKETQQERLLPNSTGQWDPLKIAYSKSGNFLTFVDRDYGLFFLDPQPLLKYDLSTNRLIYLTEKLYYDFDLSPDGTTFLATHGKAILIDRNSGLLVYNSKSGKQYDVTDYIAKHIETDSMYIDDLLNSRPEKYQWITSNQFIAQYPFVRLKQDSTRAFMSKTIQFNWNGTEITEHTILPFPEIITSNFSKTFSLYTKSGDFDPDPHVYVYETKLFVINEQTNDTTIVDHPGGLIDAIFFPDGTKLLLWVRKDFHTLCYVYDLYNASMNRLFPEATSVDHPSFSPSGERIIGDAFISGEPYNCSVIFTINTDNTKPTILSDIGYTSIAPIFISD